ARPPLLPSTTLFRSVALVITLSRGTSEPLALCGWPPCGSLRGEGGRDGLWMVRRLTSCSALLSPASRADRRLHSRPAASPCAPLGTARNPTSGRGNRTSLPH